MSKLETIRLKLAEQHLFSVIKSNSIAYDYKNDSKDENFFDDSLILPSVNDLITLIDSTNSETLAEVAFCEDANFSDYCECQRSMILDYILATLKERGEYGLYLQQCCEGGPSYDVFLQKR
jgi:hypothetical protein